MGGVPKLKPSAKLRKSTNNENATPNTSNQDDPGTLMMTFQPVDSPVLKELLLRPNIDKPQTTREHYDTNLPTCTFTATHPTQVDAATQCFVEKVNKSTSTKKLQEVHHEASLRPSPVSLNDSVSMCETPSMYGGTTSASETETVTTNKEFIYRGKVLEVIKNNPKSYIGLPKQYFWLIQHIAAQSNVKPLHIIITLLKLKQNDTVVRICDQFEISHVTFAKIFRQSIEALANFFQNLVYMPTPLQIKQNLPLVFKFRYSNVQLIIDAFEIEIEKPQRPMQQAQTWSQYKSCNTVKYLIGCTPNGHVAFISKGYGGRISDKALVSKSCLIECLPTNAVIMADRGFKEIESSLSSKNIKILRPPSVYANLKPTKEEVLMTKVIASLRIHVERVIRRVREFRFLKPHSVVSHKHVVYLNHMVLIACGLINLQNDIIKKE